MEVKEVSSTSNQSLGNLLSLGPLLITLEILMKFIRNLETEHLEFLKLIIPISRISPLKFILLLMDYSIRG